MRYAILVFGFMFLVSSCYSQTIDPPFGKDVVLKFKNVELILGFTKLNDVERKLGKPEKEESDKHGGEEFYWENIRTDHYFAEKLILVFSRKSERLVQIIFKPQQDDEYGIFWGLTNRSTRNTIETAIRDKGLTLDSSGNLSWFSFYESRKPIFTVSCGLKFANDGRMIVLNYMVDAPWEDSL